MIPVLVEVEKNTKNVVGDDRVSENFKDKFTDLKDKFEDLSDLL